jgi:metal-sulfur cluster biosynthetic enzyme
MPLDDARASLRDEIFARLEAIIDPCSAASGIPAGLVSMGLVGDVTIEEQKDGAYVRITLYITEPGCLMGALFQLTAQRELGSLPGVAYVEVSIDYGHVWGPEQMTPEYRRRLTETRARRAAHMKAQPLLSQQKRGDG